MVQGNKYFLTLLGLLVSVLLSAQAVQSDNQSQEKIRGSRFMPYPTYSGSPFLSDNFFKGELEFNDGTKLADIPMNYGTYRDELIYFNSVISAQIVVDKMSLRGFSFIDKKGIKRNFHRQYYEGSIKSDCYFEVLSEGTTELLAYRKVDLLVCDTYQSKTGMSYQPANIYFFYSPEKGYTPVNISRSSLLSKFVKADQKFIRRTLRKNGIIISDESGFIMAWNLISENGLQVKF